MRERPILFNDAMVRAILDGRKTQTRRPVLVGGAPVHHDRTEGGWRKLRDGWAWVVGSDVVGGVYPCLFGSPGDLLWVRECFSLLDADDPSRAGPVVLPHWQTSPTDTQLGRWFRTVYRADGANEHVRRWYPSTQMPRWASRLTLRVTDVRVERVQDISEDDARAEGASGGVPWLHEDESYRTAFRHLWSDTYGAESWTTNPWVWVVSFERAEVPR